MEENNIPAMPEQAPGRPSMLTILCILTFIGSGMQLFSSLFVSLFYEFFMKSAQVIAEKFNMPGMEQLQEVAPVFFVVSALLDAGAIVGAILMFRLKKIGFHIYTIFQILLILAPMYFMHLPGPGTAEVLFSGLFIILYSMNLKHMH